MRLSSAHARALLISASMWIATSHGVGVAHASGTPAVLNASPPTTATVGKPFSYTPSMRDAEGDKLTVSVYNRPAWLNIDRATGRIYGTPPAVASHGWLKYQVYDGSNYTLGEWFTINVIANAAPIITGTPATTATVGTAYNFQPSATDVNGDTLAFTIVSRPAWATFSTTTGRLSGTPTAAGTFSGIRITASDGRGGTMSLPAFSIAVAAPNRAPVISGTPARSVNAGSAYNFRPTASDADGNTLTFSVSNKPAWASFSTTTGQLSGTPTAAQVGTYSNISIRVSDGRASASLATFSIAVTQLSTGSATLNWVPPTQNTDGTALTNLAGYRIYYGTSASSLTQSVQVANAGLASYMLQNLSPATYYFAVSAYATTGAESARSNVISKIVQ